MKNVMDVVKVRLDRIKRGIAKGIDFLLLSAVFMDKPRDIWFRLASVSCWLGSDWLFVPALRGRNLSADESGMEVFLIARAFAIAQLEVHNDASKDNGTSGPEVS